MSIDQFLLAAEGVISAIERVLELRKNLSEELDAKFSAKLCKALRAFYFSPDGVVTLLKVFADGKKVSPEVLARVLPDFNDGEWEVKEAAKTLSFNELGQELRVSLKDAIRLDELWWKKINVRRDLQKLLNVNDRPTISKAKARDILAKITALNGAIANLEEALNVNQLKP